VTRRLALLAGLVFALAAAGVQAQGRVVRVAYVWLFDAGPSAPYSQPFRARLGELGWKEGKNLRFEEYDAKNDFKRLDSIMEELVRSKVDVIVAMCTPEAKAALKVTTTIPIVVTAAGDLRAAGLVTNFARPGGNVTGTSFMLDVGSTKRVELLRAAFPRLKVATVLWNPVRPDSAVEFAAMEAAAKGMGMELRSVQVRTLEELSTALEMLEVDGTQALLNSGDPMLSREIPRIIRRAAQLRIPALWTERIYPLRGGLMSWGPDMNEEARRAAEYVDRILRGEKAGDLPIQQPKRFEFVVNRKAAREQGWELPPAVMVLADEVVEK
jgi:putative ABC transport system substrate-binding protein